MDKNSLKQYFKSGNRPTQANFYSLIDACYNENHSVFASGYGVKTNLGPDEKIYATLYAGGSTKLVPLFDRINRPLKRTYHYHLPCSNLGQNFALKKIALDFSVPSNGNYQTKDKGNMVKISQSIKLAAIKFYNGSDLFLTVNQGKIPKKDIKEFNLDLNMKVWKGISIDIHVEYTIKSNIAVSDGFNLSESEPEKLTHVFGGVHAEFKPLGL